MTPDDVRRFARSELYDNPFWTDPVDPGQDPLARSAAEQYFEWAPVRRQRTKVAWVIYLAIWAVDIYLFVAWFSLPNNGNGGESLGIPAGVLLLVQLVFTPAFLLAYVQVATKKMRAAEAAVRDASVQRYQAWLGWLRQNDPATHTQVVLWHQGNQARDLAVAQTAVQVYTAYQTTQIHNELRRNRP